VFDAVSEPTWAGARRRKLHNPTNFSNLRGIAPNMLVGHKNIDINVMA
jgi:hypothetical protein